MRVCARLRSGVNGGEAWPGRSTIYRWGEPCGLSPTRLYTARDLAGMQLKTQMLGQLEQEGGGEFSLPGYGVYQARDRRWLVLVIITEAPCDDDIAAVKWCGEGVGFKEEMPLEHLLGNL